MYTASPPHQVSDSAALGGLPAVVTMVLPDSSPLLQILPLVL
jgi:hypothetical protein